MKKENFDSNKLKTQFAFPDKVEFHKQYDELLEKRKECRFTDLLIRTDSILDFVCAFLALLEAAKQHLVSIFQNRMFGDIIIRRNNI